MRKPCKFEECDRDSRALGYCGSHYRQYKNGATLTKLGNTTCRLSAEVVYRDYLGRKQCKRCRAWLPERFFAPTTVVSDGLRTNCNNCRSVQRQEQTYNLSEQQLGEMLEAQNFGCAICATRVPGGMGTWHVDHDHRCCPGKRSCGACVRGLLCYQCNVSLCRIERNYERIVSYLHG